jgi:hypothetical protein
MLFSTFRLRLTLSMSVAFSVKFVLLSGMMPCAPSCFHRSAGKVTQITV